MRFGQFIEYNKRNIFLEKSYTKVVYLVNIYINVCKYIKNQNWAYPWINSLKFLTVFFVVCQAEDYRKILKLSCRQLAFTSLKAFLKTRIGLELVSLHPLLDEFSRKIFLLLYSINTQNFTVWLSLLYEIFYNMCIVIVC